MKKIVINLFFILSLNVDTFLLIQIMFIHTYVYIFFYDRVYHFCSIGNQDREYPFT